MKTALLFGLGERAKFGSPRSDKFQPARATAQINKPYISRLKQMGEEGEVVKQKKESVLLLISCENKLLGADPLLTVFLWKLHRGK